LVKQLVNQKNDFPIRNTCYSVFHWKWFANSHSTSSNTSRNFTAGS